MRNIIKSAFVRACVIFTVAMALWCAAGLIFAGPVEGIVITLSLLAAALALCALQAFWFTEAALTRPSYPARIAGFGLTGLPVLVLCAALGGWFPLDNIGAWVSFVAIYLDADGRQYATEADRNLLYVAVTRAMHALTVLYRDEPSPLLGEQ